MVSQSFHVCSLLLGELERTLTIMAEVRKGLQLQVINAMTSHQVAGTGGQTWPGIGSGTNL